jgi:hypothetical protein
MDPLDLYTNRLFHIESGGRPDARTGSNRGLGQFGPDEEREFGITNWQDPDQQRMAVAREYNKQSQIYQNHFGGPPQPWQSYLIHQQGDGGGPALLAASQSHPDEPAWATLRPMYKSDAVARRAITGNIPSDSPLYGRNADDISNAQFTGIWRDKFNNASYDPAIASGGVAPAAAGSTATAALNPAGTVATALVQPSTAPSLSNVLIGDATKLENQQPGGLGALAGLIPGGQAPNSQAQTPSVQPPQPFVPGGLGHAILQQQLARFLQPPGGAVS